MTYTLKELLALRNEWLATLSDEPDSWYTSMQEVSLQATYEFFKWLNIRENTP